MEDKVILQSFKVGPMECNCSIVAAENGDAVVVDPGGNAEEILERIKTLGVKVKFILITHAHFDHVLAARAVKEATGAKICLHKKDMWLYRIMPLQYRMMAGVKDKRPPSPDRKLKDGDRFEVGELVLDVMHTPGHSPGSSCFHLAAQKTLFSGDTLFKGSVGNWEYPGGSYEKLIRSITEKLLMLPDDTRVIPGHGDETTIGVERATNEYLQEGALEKALAWEAKRPGKVKFILMMLVAIVGSLLGFKPKNEDEEPPKK